MLTRRSALALLPALALPRPVRAAPGLRVVVLGAGAAGLAAARDLADAGALVTVIEARGRIGGRLHTSRLWPDLPVDLGASWIHGVRGNPVSGLADAAGAGRVETSYDRSLSLGPDGKKADLGDAMAGRLVEKARARAEGFDRDVSLAEAVTTSPAWAKADAETRRRVRHHVNATYEQEYAGDWAELSAWWGDAGEEFGGGDVLFPGGYDQIASHLARGLDVRLGAAVTGLAPDGKGVALTLADGGTVRADRVVVTLPLGVLQSGTVRFAEPLTPARQKAITALGMGLLNKCWLRFDQIAWDDTVDWIEWLSPQDGYWSQWVSLARATGAPVLVGFHAGTQAREVEALDDAATLSAAHAALRAMFGSRFPAPLAAQITRWSQDPFARGSYSFHATGSTPDDRRALAGTDWNGRLAFAGEAASADHPGTVHGAVLSGRDAARAVLQGAP
jgi:monoamine oxidase